MAPFGRDMARTTLIGYRVRMVLLVVLAVLTVIMGVIDTRAYHAKLEHNHELKRDGVRANAEVLDYRGTGRWSSEITIRVIDGPQAGFTASRTVYKGQRRSAGETVTVFHARTDPNDILIVGYDQNDRVWGWLFATLTIGMGVELLFGRGRRAGRS